MRTTIHWPGNKAADLSATIRTCGFHAPSTFINPQVQMKAITLFTAAILFTLQAAAQQTTESSYMNMLTTDASTGVVGVRYRDSERGADMRVWEKVVTEKDDSGRVTEAVQESFVELATGLHYRAGEQWLETKEAFEVVPGWAIAYKGPHKVALAYNLNTRGSVAVTMANGRAFRSHIIGLYYLDPATGQSVFIADVKDCEGKVVGANQVIYENAFNGIKADACYRYSKSGIEQDIILRQQPPSPVKYGLDPATTRLAVLTEFLDPPEATVMGRGPGSTLAMTQSKGGDDAFELEDQEVSFGTMRIVRGKSFNLGADPYDNPARNPGMKRVPVVKKWLVQDGRTFLFEEIPLAAAQEELSKLPEQASIRRRNAWALIAGLEIPKQRQVERASNRTMQMASVGREQREPGFVMDYFLVNVNTNNFVFQGDTTYYVSGPVTISGKITLEGGTVIKLSPTNSAKIVSADGNFECRTGPYRPAILTARDDDSVGEVISGSTGVPTNYLTGFHVYGAGTPVFKHMAVRYAVYGLSVYTAAASTISDVQFVKCNVGLDFHSNAGRVRNCIFDRVDIPFAGAAYQYSVENVTVNDCAAQFSHKWSGTSTIAMTNCIAVGLTNWGNATTILTNNSVASLTPMPSLFQSMGAGNYYLATNSPYRNVGWTNINATLLNDLKSRTTYPPVMYSNVVLDADTTLGLQVSRDTDTPDLGYHYNPVDYWLSYLWVSNAAVKVATGVVVGCQDDYGFFLREGGSIECIGTPLAPNWFASYKAVQEQPLKFGTSGPTFVIPYQTNDTVITGDFQFTKFATLATSSGYLMYHSSRWNFDSLQVRNCEFWNGLSYFGGDTNTSVVLANNLFARSRVQAIIGTDVTNWLSYSNNLNVNAVVRFGSSASSNYWSVFNNAFDASKPAVTNQFAVNGYNAYFNCTFRLYPTNEYDLVATNSLAYQSGPLGDFYQPTNSLLINVGSTTADLVGLYHFTTTTNQAKETNTTVDLGYHYVAVDGNGYPLDYDGDGLPDYFEDSNGNGTDDATDLASWLNADTDGDGVNDYIEYITGRNLRAGAIADPNGLTGLLLFTPLK